MKKGFFANFGWLLLLLSIISGAGPAIAQNKEPEYSYKDFYDNLAPYGQWIEDSAYGYVWSPDVDGGFRPYFTAGHWVVTQYGNTWISDYVWGWACFHYGRWTFDSYYGWLWIPGSDWGAAWVIWRAGGGYFGWAPMDNDFKFKPNLQADNYTPPKDWWVFLPNQYLYSGNFYSFWSGPTGNPAMFKNTKQLNNYFENDDVTYVVGPSAKQVEKATGKKVPVYNLGVTSNLTTKIHNEDIKMFRPASIKKLYVLGNNPAPPGVVPSPKPVSSRPQPVNAQLGTVSSPFKKDLIRNPSQVHLPGKKTTYATSNMAPQPTDAVSYDWKNPEQAEQPQSLDYKVAPAMHPDHGPNQHFEPAPKPKDPNPKKLPVQGSQSSEPVKPEEQYIRK